MQKVKQVNLKLVNYIANPTNHKEDDTTNDTR